MATDNVRGQLDLMLLRILDDGPGHGYSVIGALRRRSGETFDLPEGTVYPALHRLEEAGLLASDWEAVDGRRRRIYRLTSPGVVALADARSRWAHFVSAVEAVLAPLTQRPLTQGAVAEGMA
ncbi:MAG: PadR family transcriptional regulator [Acidimicrobiales bacterium]